LILGCPYEQNGALGLALEAEILVNSWCTDNRPIIGIGRLSAVLPIIGIGRLLCWYRPIVIYYVLWWHWIMKLYFF